MPWTEETCSNCPCGNVAGLSVPANELHARRTKDYAENVATCQIAREYPSNHNYLNGGDSHATYYKHTGWPKQCNYKVISDTSSGRIHSIKHFKRLWGTRYLLFTINTATLSLDGTSTYFVDHQRVNIAIIYWGCVYLLTERNFRRPPSYRQTTLNLRRIVNTSWVINWHKRLFTTNAKGCLS